MKGVFVMLGDILGTQETRNTCESAFYMSIMDALNIDCYTDVGVRILPVRQLP